MIAFRLEWRPSFRLRALVSSTEVVAIIGASSTVVAAVAGYVFSYFTARRQEAGQLARDAQQHEHERELARSARLFERRAPEPPNFEEWRAMQARLGTYGSADVSDAFGEYWEAIEALYNRVQ
jgi:hypothetical protein